MLIVNLGDQSNCQFFTSPPLALNESALTISASSIMVEKHPWECLRAGGISSILSSTFTSPPACHLPVAAAPLSAFLETDQNPEHQNLHRMKCKGALPLSLLLLFISHRWLDFSDFWVHQLQCSRIGLGVN